MPARPKLVGDKDRLIPATLRRQVLAYLHARAKVGQPRSRKERSLHALLTVRLASQAGLRISEIAHLRVKDCDLAREPYRVFVVGGKMRAEDHVDEQPIPADLARDLKAHVAGVAPDWFVVGRRPVAFTRQYLYQLVKAVHGACGVPTIYNVHSWRHAYGTEVYRQTKDLMLTRDLMRHRETATTEKYVHMAESDEQVGRAMRGLTLDAGGDAEPEAEAKKKPARRSPPARAAKAGRR